MPARYTLLTSLGLALLAGEGFDCAISNLRFRLGLSASLAFAGCAAVAALLWAGRSDVHLVSALGGTFNGFAWAGLAWFVALIAVLAWRSQKLPSCVPVIALTIELGIQFYAVHNPMGLGDCITRTKSGLDRIGGPIARGPGRGREPRICRSASGWEPLFPTWDSRTPMPT